MDRIANGLRHSCISYWLAANPEHGVALTAQWAGNSENTIRHHYRRLLKKADGDAWFAVQEFWREIEAADQDSGHQVRRGWRERRACFLAAALRLVTCDAWAPFKTALRCARLYDSRAPSRLADSGCVPPPRWSVNSVHYSVKVAVNENPHTRRSEKIRRTRESD